MKIWKLQCTLVNIAVTMYNTEKEPESDTEKPSPWEQTLGEYDRCQMLLFVTPKAKVMVGKIDRDILVQALQEYDYMVKSNQRSRDPFIVTGQYYPDHYVLYESIPTDIRDKVQLKSGPLQKFERGDQTHGTKETSIVGPRRQNKSMSQQKKFEQRLGVATISGIFLFGFMWLMVLHSTLNTSLIATTLFVAAFGFIVAWCGEDQKDVLASTAAYGAVLVVFVGSTTNQVS